MLAASMVLALDNPAGNTSYGASKAALNWIARTIHFENEGLVFFPLVPGGVETDMARAGMAMAITGALTAMMEGNTTPADVAAPRLIDLITNATREKDSWNFVVIGKERLPQ